MDDQERNHEALIDRFAEQARIIRHRNDRIAEVEARGEKLALELAHAATRADKAEQERDEARRYECSDLDAHWRLGKALASLKEANATVASLRAEQPRPLSADDITDEMIERAREVLAREEWVQPFDPETADMLDREDHADTTRVIIAALTAALTEPTRPEGAEKVEQERDDALRIGQEALNGWREEQKHRAACRDCAQPRPLTTDDIEQLVTQNRCRVADAIRALYPEEPMATDVLAHAVMTALTEPTRPEEKVEAVLHQYWSGDINGDDLANRIVEEMNR